MTEKAWYQKQGAVDSIASTVRKQRVKGTEAGLYNAMANSQ